MPANNRTAESTLAIRRYNALCARECSHPGTIRNAQGVWRALSSRLSDAADTLTGDRATFVRDRAVDSMHRATRASYRYSQSTEFARSVRAERSAAGAR